MNKTKSMKLDQINLEQWYHVLKTDLQESE